MRTTAPRPGKIHELNCVLKLGDRDGDLCEVAQRRAGLEGLRNPMRLGSLDKMVGHDHLRPVAGREAAERLEILTIRLQLDVRVREGLRANLLEERRALKRTCGACASLDRRAQGRNRPRTDAVRESPDFRRSQIPNV